MSHTKFLQCYLPYSLCYIPGPYLFYNWMFIPLNPLHLFCFYLITLSPLATIHLFSVSVSLFILFCVLHSIYKVRSYSIFLSLTFHLVYYFPDSSMLLANGKFFYGWILFCCYYYYEYYSVIILGFPDSSVRKESACNAGDPSSIPGLGRSAGEGIGYPLEYSWASLVAQLVKNPPAVGRPGFNPWVGMIHRRRERLPTLVSWPRELHGLYSLWGPKELDMTERLSFSFSVMLIVSFAVQKHFSLI